MNRIGIDQRVETKDRLVRLQFSLRGLFVLAAWLALILGWAILANRWAAVRQWDRGFVGIAPTTENAGKGQLLVTSYSVTIPRDRYILVRSNDGMGAFMLTDEVDEGDGGVRYVWRFAPSGVAALDGPETLHGEGTVFERYVREPAKDGFVVKDVGGDTRIRCGPIAVEWSLGNHIYLPEDEPLQVAYTGCERINDVRPDDPSLIWFGKTMGKVGAQLEQ